MTQKLMSQRTIGKKIQFNGIGLHSGGLITVSMYPMPANTGICFQRTDIKGSQKYLANASNVGATENNTTIGKGADSILTVEHLLSMVFGLGIDNIFIEVDGPEIPIMDGSAASFLYVFKQAGLKLLSAPKRFLVLKEKVRVEMDDKYVEVEPCDGFEIESKINFKHPKINGQEFSFKFTSDSFINDICRARTFGFLKEVDYLKKKGLIKGGSLDNAIVLDDFNVLNPDGLRYEDEFVRHKILDTVGDFSLLGFNLAMKIKSYKSGHLLHNKLCKKLLKNDSCFEIVSASELVPENTSVLHFPKQLIAVS